MTPVPSTTRSIGIDTNPGESERAAVDHPQGRLEPTDDRARRAVKAIDEKRFDDAAKHIGAIPEDSIVTQAWKSYLSGRLHWERHDLVEAEKHLAETIDLLNDNKSADNKMANAELVRLAASAHELMGTVLRREDRPACAFEHHQTAYQTRNTCGTNNELCESATSLGIDSQIMQDRPNAVHWHQVAVSHAEQVDRASTLLPASLTNLSNAFLESEQFAEAVEAARSAYDLWSRIDPAAPETTSANANLAAALLHLAQSQMETDLPHAEKTLREAVQRFDAARVSLLSFGPEFINEARQCSEKLDFANRLISSLTV